MSEISDFSALIKQPLVSVIMNCYNGEKYLNEAIDSVLNQTYRNIEIIFWDNQSTDNSAKICNQYSDERLKYYYAPTHTWLYEARNYAIEKSNGEYIAFLDVDDKWLPNKLKNQIPYFSDPKVAVVCANYWIEHERKHKKWLALTNHIPSGWVLDDLLKNYFVGLVTLIIRKSAFNMLSYPCDPRYHIIGDFDLVIRLSISWKLEYVKEPVAIYRIHDSNESAKHRDRHVDELKCWLSEMKKFKAVRTSKNWHMLLNNFIYLQAINKFLQGSKKEAFNLSNQLPWGIQKFRLLFIALLPKFIISRLKN